jgi:hypothetical protein
MENGVNVTFRIPIWLDRLCAWPVVWYRRWKYGYSFRKIYLGEGEWSLVEPPDFYRFNIFNWCLRENGPNRYAVRLVKGHKNRSKIVSLHREIMNHPKGLLVDHKNNNGLDNRRLNLRLATQSQNRQNRAKRKNTSSRFNGVGFDKQTDKWKARIKTNGKEITLGRFENEIEAAKAYDEAAKKYHGEFARLNFP